MPEWTLRPGQRVVRTELHRTFGGRRQGGIGPSSLTPNVLLFTDVASGLQHGYVDGWQADGCFHYTGEGQRGDQRLLSGNAAILRHREEGRALRLFQGTGGEVEYVDEFEVDADTPFYATDAPESGGGPVRQVIVFRLRPRSIGPAGVGPAGTVRLPSHPTVEHVPVESRNVERFFVEPSREPVEAERREAALCLAFKQHLEAQGLEVTRLKITPAGEVKPLFSDIYVSAQRLLVEAKGAVDRNSIRMAIGQLIDYRRFVPGATIALLVPESPRPDLLDLALAAGLEVFWREAGGFARRSRADVPSAL